MREKRERDVKSRGWGRPWAGAAAFWGDGRSVFERGRACFCRQKRGMKIPGGARRKGKGHDPQARGPGRAGECFSAGGALGVGQRRPGGIFPPAGNCRAQAAPQRLHRLVPVRVHVGHSRRAGAFSCGEAMFTRRCRVRASCAKEKRVDCRKTAGECASAGHQAPEGERRRKRKKTPVARMRQEQISGALADQMLW